MSLQVYDPQQPLVQQYSAACVIGLGVSGYSAVRYLSARGLEVTVVDSRSRPPMAERLAADYPQLTGHFGSLDGDLISKFALLVVSPGVALSEPALRQAKQQGAHIVGDIELFLQENSKPVIAITGSNGKSTVTSLVGAMASTSGMKPLVAGNIGLPALDALTDRSGYDLAVLELSSFQLESTSQVPAEAAAILNVSADHLDRYDSMGDYLLAKARILRGAQRAILPRHDEQLKQISNVSEILSFDLDEPANDNEFGLKRISSQRWLVRGSQRLIKLRDIPLTGLHNVKNVLAAFALVDFLKLPAEQLVTAVKEFRGLPHRMQTVAVQNGVTWVNDSKATNVGATSTALRNLEQEVIWIAGGQGKGADFEELRDAVTSHIKLLILIGEDAPKIEAALAGALPIKHASSMKAAVALADQSAQNGYIVLLSPACASFDMYRSFEHRGDDFTGLVEARLKRSAA